MKALVLEDSNYSAVLSIVRTLGRLGHEVVVAAPCETPATRSRWCHEHVVSPAPADAEPYAEFVLSLLRARGFDIGFATDDGIMGIISRIRAELPRRPEFLLAPAQSVEIARNKVAAARFAARLGVPTPRTVAPRELADLDAAARETGFPLVVKADMGAGGAHVRYATDADELRRAYREIAAMTGMGRPMVQEFIPGDAYLTQVLYDRGKLVAICSHRKLRQFPLAGGVLAKAVTVDEPQLDAQVERIFTALAWHGPAKADFKRDQRDGRFKLMELDPRLPAGIDVARAAGVDLVGLCCRMVAAGSVEPQLGYRKGVAARYVCRDLICVAAQPGLLPAILLDSVNPRVRSDFDWRDLGGTWGLLRRGAWAFEQTWRSGQLTEQLAGRDPAAPCRSRLRRSLHRLVPGLAGGALLSARVLYGTAKAAHRCARAALGRAADVPAAMGAKRHRGKAI
jgi:predicted ATP-grasp superfamily ATP-dependent carboligase